MFRVSVMYMYMCMYIYRPNIYSIHVGTPLGSFRGPNETGTPGSALEKSHC